MLKKTRVTKGFRWVVRGLPLVAILGASMLPLSKTANQFLMLAVLLWLQAFIVFECFLIDR
jgi:hypothetical protein